MIDKKKLVAMLSIEYGISIDEKDPLFAAVVLSDEVLKEYINIIKNEQESIVQQVAILNETHNKNMTEQLKLINKNQNTHFLKVLNEVSNSKEKIEIKESGYKNAPAFFIGVAAGAALLWFIYLLIKIYI